MTNMPSRSQASSNSGVGGLCEVRYGVAAELLQFFHAEFLQRIRDGRADAGVVLVIAGAVKFVMLAVQQKAVRRVKAHGADAEGGFFLVNNFAVDGNGGDELVKFGDSGDQRTGEEIFVSNFTVLCDLRFNFSDSENFFSDLPSGEMISQFTVAFAALVCVLSRLTSTLISGLPCGTLFSNSLCTKIPSGAMATGAVLSSQTWR